MKKQLNKIINKGRKILTTRRSLSKQNKDLIKFKNIHKGKECIILGAGPSLNDLPDEFLDRFIVIGTNLSFKHYKPDYWVVVDAQYSWLVEGRELCQQNQIPAFINWRWFNNEETLSVKTNEISLHHNHISTEQSQNNKQLIHHLTSIYNKPDVIEKIGFTSVNSVVSEGAIPLAAYMGFEKIYLIGVDYYIPDTGKIHFIDDDKEDLDRIQKLTKWAQEKENSDRDIFAIKKWVYEIISETNLNGKVFNLSEKSTVKKIPKLDYKSL